MPNQTDNGKAFEFACLKGLESIIYSCGHEISSHIEMNDSYEKAKHFFDSIGNSEHKNILLKAGEKMAEKLSHLEPRLIYPVNGFKDIINLEIQPDKKGIQGDVRDVLALKILLKSESVGWEIGISCKHNHNAVKHQRISNKIDIGSQWFASSSKDGGYFDEINPVFSLISSLQSSPNNNWSDVQNKENDIYVPLLNAIKNEIIRIVNSDCEQMCGNFLSYLIGKNDFYKVVVEKNKSVSLQGFNFFGTLNKSADKHHPKYTVPKMKLPKIIHNIDFKPNSKTTIHIAMDEGWSVSMRIHSASTKIENSLKIDTQLIGVPQTQYRETMPIIE